MKLNFTQKAYLSGTLFYLVLITALLSVFQPSDSARNSISKGNKINNVIIQDNQYVSDSQQKSINEAIIPFSTSADEVDFIKLNQKERKTLTKL